MQFPPLWHDHKSHLSQSKSVTSLRRVRFRMAGMRWCQLSVGLPAAQDPGQAHREREGNHPRRPQLPQALRAARHSGDHAPLASSLPMREGLAPLGGCLVRHLHLSLPSVRDMLLDLVNIKRHFFLTLDKSTFVFPCMSVCVQTDMCILECKAPACQDDGSRMRWIKLKLVEVQGKKRIFKEKKGL